MVRAQQPDSTVADSSYSQVLLVISDPPAVHKIDPPLIYKRWWKEVERCARLYVPTRQLNKVQWYSINADGFLYRSDSAAMLQAGHMYLGYTWSELNMIIIADRGSTGHGIDNEDTVKHEMIHYLMYHHGLPPGHPKDIYNRCHIMITKPHI